MNLGSGIDVENALFWRRAKPIAGAPAIPDLKCSSGKSLQEEIT
ncbi:MAG TPA: hypothetical protein VFF26_14470 [Gallionella sp.]|nr:hypothetical protein [Gallionella sp.]